MCNKEQLRAHGTHTGSTIVSSELVTRRIHASRKRCYNTHIHTQLHTGRQDENGD